MTRLEESLAFMERTVEQMHEEMLTLVRKVDALTARLVKAEASLLERGASGEAGLPKSGGPAQEFELPPHSHMPLDRQAGRTTDPFAPPPETDPPETLR